MNNIPDDRVYSDEHVWILMESENIAKIGITEHAQSELDDIVYLELPNLGDECISGQSCAVVESVKTASDVYAPVDGKVLEINDDLIESPEKINESPYEYGWLIKVELHNKSAIDSLMNASQYDSYVST